MVGYDDVNNALTLGDDDSLKVGDYELEYSSTDNEWQARYGLPIGGGVGNHGQIFGDSEYLDTSQSGGAHSYKANSTGYIATDYIGTTETFSVAFFVRVDSDFGSQWLMQMASDSGDGWGVKYLYEELREISDGTEQTVTGIGIYDDTDANDIAIGTTPINMDQWYHVTATIGSTSQTLYIDGSEVGSKASVGSVRNNEVAIGTRFADGTGSIDSDFSMDDFRVYDRELTASEASDLSNGVDVTGSLDVHYTFEYPETPSVAVDVNGDVYPKNAVSRSTSGSLIPQGLAESLSAGEVLSDDGNTYTSVQTAVDNATGWVLVGPGTFNENVTISTAGLTLEGIGDDTLILGGGSNVVDISAQNVTIRNLRVSDGGNGIVVNTGGDGALISGVTVDESTGTIGSGIDILSRATIVRCDCTGSSAIDPKGSGGDGSIITGCVVDSRASGTHALNLDSDDLIVTNNIVTSAGVNGIRNDGADCVIGGNRISNADNYGIYNVGVDNIIFNNRVSDSTTADIEDNGTGTVLDGNLTGASN